MNANDAIEFLIRHQPMPDFPDLEVERQFGQALATLYLDPKPEAIPLLVNCFGNWEDLVFSEYVRSVLIQFPPDLIYPHLLAGLASSNANVRFGCADLATYFPHPDQVPLLAEIMTHPSAIYRMVAATSLEQIGGKAAAAVAGEALPREDDEEICDILISIIGKAGKRPRPLQPVS